MPLFLIIFINRLLFTCFNFGFLSLLSYLIFLAGNRSHLFGLNSPGSEFLNTACSIYKLSFASVKRVAVGADLGLCNFFSTADMPNFATGTFNLGLGEICRMNILLHNDTIIDIFLALTIEGHIKIMRPLLVTTGLLKS